MTSHRAETRARLGITSVIRGRGSVMPHAGRRRLQRPRADRPWSTGSPLRVGAGLSALTLAVVGAIGTSVPLAQASAPPAAGSLVAAAPVPTTGLSNPTIASAIIDRQVAISRESSRQALEVATEADLRKSTSAVGRERFGDLRKFASRVEKFAAKFAEASWVLPINSGTYTLTATFGEGSSLWANRHTGLDFAAPSGTPVMAVTDAVVAEAAYAGAYGNRVVLTDEQGTTTYYCHLTAFAVRTGQRVRAGQVIGSVGSTGNSTGPHMHFEVRPGGGDPVDPFAALVARGLRP